MWRAREDKLSDTQISWLLQLVIDIHEAREVETLLKITEGFRILFGQFYINTECYAMRRLPLVVVARSNLIGDP